MTRNEITDVLGVGETDLPPSLVDQLPANLAPAPWNVRSQSVVWWCRGGSAARQALPPALRSGRALAVVGGMVRYDDTPVGAYDEVFGVVMSSNGGSPFGTVSFMAVDSPASLVGGRTNWAMPKTLAAFEGTVGSGQTMSARSATEMSWNVRATPTVIGPALPTRSTATVRQQVPDGSVRGSRLQSRGRMRPALVKVEVESAGELPTWLRPGRHLGAVIDGFAFSLAEPSA
jgi:hypothetical protein